MTDGQQPSPIHGGKEIGGSLFYRILKQLGVNLEAFDRLR
jgi:hypothetical protein